MQKRGMASIKPAALGGFKSYNPNEHTMVSKAVKAAMENSWITKDGWKPSFSPSSFPLCSIKSWMKIYRGEALGYYESEKGFGSSFFTEIGHVVHETVQFFLGDSALQWGDWKCKNKKCIKYKEGQPVYNKKGKRISKGKMTRTATTKNKCPKCKERMGYEEVKIMFKGIKGYVDGIFMYPDGSVWVVDYKTTSMSKVEKGACLDKKHLIQVPAYALALEDNYDLDVRGYSLVYIPRDRPFAFVEHAEEFNNKQRKIIIKQLKKEIKGWKAVQKTIDDSNLERIIEAKPCATENEYRRCMHSFDDCPMLSVCFSDSRLRKSLRTWKDAHDSGKVPELLKFDDAVQVICNKDYKKMKGLGLKTRNAVKRPIHRSF